jgi:hypothetical protein
MPSVIVAAAAAAVAAACCDRTIVVLGLFECSSTRVRELYDPYVCVE